MSEATYRVYYCPRKKQWRGLVSHPAISTEDLGYFDERADAVAACLNRVEELNDETE